MVKNEKKIFLRKSVIFQPLMRGTAKQHRFLHIGAHLVAKGVLGHMRQIHPISTCTEGKSANFSKYGFSPEPTLDLAFLVRPKPSTGMPATKYGQQRENRKSHPGGPEKTSKNKKIFFFGKVRNFSVLDKGDCQTAWGFAH